MTSKQKFRLVIPIIACDKIEKYAYEIRRLNQTWGAKALEYPEIKIIFFLGQEKTTEFTGDLYVNLPGVNDDYTSATDKQYLGIKYMYDNFDFDFLFLTASDVYVNIPKLLSYLNNFNPNDNLYIGDNGRIVNILNNDLWFHSGIGVTLSYEAVKKIYPILSPNLKYHWADICRQNNTYDFFKDACDVALSYYLQQPDINVKVVRALGLIISCINENWPNYTYDNFNDIIAFHALTNDQFHILDMKYKTNNYMM